MTHRFYHLGCLFTLIVIIGSTTPLAAQLGKNEEVLLFDGSPGQTGTENGGTVIFPQETKSWRFWYQDVFHSVVSPDGRKVAYKYQTSLNIADINGQNVKTLLFDTLSTSVSWAPTGDRLAFYTATDLVIIDLDGNELAAYPVTLQSGAPSWSPDGSRIVLMTNKSDNQKRLLSTIDVATGAFSEIYEPVLIDAFDSYFSEGVGHPVYSPDGEQIAVLQNTWSIPDRSNGDSYYTTGIAVMPASGGTPTLLTNLAEASDAGNLPIIQNLTWSPDGTEIAYSVQFGAGVTPTIQQGIYRVSKNGGTSERITGFVPYIDRERVPYNWHYGFQWTILNPGPKLEISVSPDRTDYNVDEEVTVEFKISNGAADPATYTFEDAWLSVDPEPGDGEDAILDIDLPEAPAPFVLDEDNPEWSFTIPATAKKPGVLNLRAMVSVEPLEGEPYTLEAEESVLVSPIGTEITITNKRHSWNTTMESEWGERAKAINQQRRMDAQEPYQNLIEFELAVNNNADQPIDKLNVPGVRDVLSYIQSTSEDPAVPLLPVRLYAPDGAEVDLTNPEDPTKVNDVTLEPGESATFAWVVEAFQIDPETRDDPYDLEFSPLVLGRLSGENIQTAAEETFSIRVRGPIVVNVTSDERDADPNDGVIDVDLDEDGEQVSLRAAIEFANDTPGLDRIEFDIPGDGVPTIKVGLPPEGTNVLADGPDGDVFPFPPSDRDPRTVATDYLISSSLKTTDPVEIDGTTQVGGWVEVSGSDVPRLINGDLPSFTNRHMLVGLEIAGGDSEIRGLIINDFTGIGMALTETGNNRISGNRIGTNKNGDQSIANFQYRMVTDGESGIDDIFAGGLLVTCGNNLIGGTKREDRNLISNVFPFSETWNSSFASDLTFAGSNSRNNKVTGNLIGTDAEGDTPILMGGEHHPHVEKDRYGISNFGITIKNGASDITIGGRSIAERNVVTQIIIENGSKGVNVMGNHIGVSNSGDQILEAGELFFEVGGLYVLDSSDVIVKNNVFSDQWFGTVQISDSSNISVYGNRFGVFENGNRMPVESLRQFYIRNSENVSIGGLTTNEGNIIGFPDPKSAQADVSVLLAFDGQEKVEFIGNTIVSAADLKISDDSNIIDLGWDGVDPLDFGDFDGKQNYPRLAFVTPENGNLRFEGNLDSHLGGDTYYLDFYILPEPLPSGHGGASMTYVGRGTVETDTVGYGQFDIVFPFTDFEDSDYFTVTATRVDGSGETSEFSRNRRIQDTLLHELNRDAYGDRNGDGTDDVDQDNVASFAAPNGADTTIEVSAATSQTSTGRISIAGSDFSNLDDADLILESVIPETQASMGAPRNYSYSNGVLTFEVLNLEAGASVSVRLILADAATPDTLWILQSDSTWTDALPTSIEGNQVTLILTDGGSGDRDGEANGRIVAALGPATALPPLPKLELEIARRSDSHILSWPLPYNNALLEFSGDLTPESWSPIDFLDPEISEDSWQITLPNPQPDLFPDFPTVPQPSGFYRLRIRE